MRQERIHDDCHTVLVVDDEALVRWSLREALAERGFQVLEAPDGRTALRRAGSDIDLVILDHRLPDTDGLGVLRELKQRHPDLPVMMLTAFGTEELVSAALAGGAFHVGLKPFDVAAVVERVNTALSGARP
ncbi:MAG: response regulator [Planctomycetota bacterium]|jgi:DNA-binding response OmpR family regulator